LQSGGAADLLTTGRSQLGTRWGIGGVNDADTACGHVLRSDFTPPCHSGATTMWRAQPYNPCVCTTPGFRGVYEQTMAISVREWRQPERGRSRCAEEVFFHIFIVWMMTFRFWWRRGESLSIRPFSLRHHAQTSRGGCRRRPAARRYSHVAPPPVLVSQWFSRGSCRERKVAPQRGKPPPMRQCANGVGRSAPPALASSHSFPFPVSLSRR